MTTMLETMARAIYERDAQISEPEFVGWEREPARHQVYVALARAALQAIREPGEVLRNAGGRLAGDYRSEWIAMIDAILNEKPGDTT